MSIVRMPFFMFGLSLDMMLVDVLLLVDELSVVLEL